MIFSSWPFLAFFLCVFCTYWALPTRRARHVFLFLASCYFYMAWNMWLVALMLFMAFWDYALARMIDTTSQQTRRKLYLTLSISGNLAVLAIFKYADFFILSFRDLLDAIGLSTSLHSLHIILPIGISFYTFQTMSYTIDVYRRVIKPTRSFIDFSMYVIFFPQLVAGPIVRAKDFLPQLASKKHFDKATFTAGLGLFLLGLTKKLFIADQLAPIVDRVFADPTQYATADLWLGMFAYGAQIFCDFSGYSDMAIATAGMLGFKLPQNFASPYLARNITDFWRRWHISLSTWLRDYLYIPLGGSRDGRLRTYRNLMITMLLGGLWHGASWTFMIWGAIHGLLLVGHKALTATGRPLHRYASGINPTARIPSVAPVGGCGVHVPLSQGSLRFALGFIPSPLRGWNPMNKTTLRCSVNTVASWALTLLAVHLAWVFFRCQPMRLNVGDPEPLTAALSRAVYYVQRLFVPVTGDDLLTLPSRLTCTVLLLIMACMQIHDEAIRRDWRLPRMPVPVAATGYTAWVIILVLFSPGNTNPFIYFQF